MARYFSYWNVTRGLLLAVILVLSYFIPNWYILFPLHQVMLTRVDHWVFLNPLWIWIYITYYPLLIAGWFVTTGSLSQRVYFDALFIAAVVGFAVFLFFPTTVDRTLYPWHGTGWSALMLSWIRGADTPVNCLPSMHVCMSFIACACMSLSLSVRGRIFVWTLFVAICYSTLATKQHYFVDLVSGFCLGAVAVAIGMRRYGILPHLPHMFSEKSVFKIASRD